VEKLCEAFKLMELQELIQLTSTDGKENNLEAVEEEPDEIVCK